MCFLWRQKKVKEGLEGSFFLDFYQKIDLRNSNPTVIQKLI